jgi:type I restriction enzyme M protein
VCLRLSDEYNQKGEDSGTKDLTLQLPDPYANIPTYDELIEWEHPKDKDRSKRGINDLDIISGIHSTQINDAMSGILRTRTSTAFPNRRVTRS